MNVKEAARTAKKYLVDLLSDEEITHVGIEEVEFEDASQDWKITIGFTRPWDHKNALITALGDQRPARSYKVIRIDDDEGCVKSVKDRVLPAST